MRNLGSRTKASLPIAGNLPTVVYCPNSNRPVSKPAAQSYGSYSTHLSGNVFRTDSALGSNTGFILRHDPRPVTATTPGHIVLCNL